MSLVGVKGKRRQLLSNGEQGGGHMRISGLGLHLTDRCTARCQHCAYHCAPELEGVMGLEDARQYLRHLAHQPLELVCLSGGEPCLYPDLTVKVVREARAMGVPSIWVFSNAYWAVTRAGASRGLARPREAGMTRLCLSADSFHQSFVPVGRVRHAMAVARDVGLEVVLDVRSLGPPQEDNASNRITRRVLEEPDDLEHVEVWQGQPRFIGRAADELLPQSVQRAGIPGGSCPGPWAGGTWENPAGVDVDLYGEVTLCPGISLGNAKKRPFGSILAEYQPRLHPIIRELAAGGPASLAEMAKHRGYTPRAGYVRECHLCYDVRKFLRSRYPSRLAPRICYEEVAA